MTLQVTDVGSVDRAISAIEVTDVGNVNRVISEIRVFDTSLVDHVVYSTASTLTADADPTSVFGYDSGSGTAETDPSVVTPSGGVPAYTYLWTLIGHTSPVTPTITSPTSASTTFVQAGLDPSDYQTATFRCRVTDSTAATADAYVNAGFYSGI